MRFAYARRLAAGAGLLALAVAVAVHHHFARPQLLKPGDRIVPLAVTSLEGTNATLVPAGRPQVLNVFATWCPPCRAEMPALAKLASQLQQRGIDVVGIDQQEPVSAVAAFARDFTVPYPVYVDETNVTHDVLGARIIPTTIVIDSSGVIRWERSGPLDNADMRELMNAVASAG
ncbi:MAG TPA: TlpA disulfide reductase family protein [Candidatus Baltobacteraceae bacterium]|nr:TlpA disulfide reductase family protein [Candidatus Baltobacteraceae bacterium]